MSEWPATKARRVLAALHRIGWQIKRSSGSHLTLCRPGWPDFVFSFHGDEEAWAAHAVACHGYLTKEEFRSGRGRGRGDTRQGQGAGINRWNIFSEALDFGGGPGGSFLGILKSFAHQMAPQEFIPHVAVAGLKTKVDESHPLIERTSRITFEHLEQYET